ncbi:MAG: hypothetical protein V3T33_08685 [Myxococcota bacterium]
MSTRNQLSRTLGKTLGTVRRTGLGAALGLALLGLALPLPADAADNGPKRGRALVEGTDLVSRTVTLFETVYQVTTETRLVGIDGSPTRLEDLRSVTPQSSPLKSPAGGDVVRFQASKGPGGWVLKRLQVLESIPE